MGMAYSENSKLLVWPTMGDIRVRMADGLGLDYEKPRVAPIPLPKQAWHQGFLAPSIYG